MAKPESENGMKTISLRYDDIHRGSLILVNQAHGLRQDTAHDLIPVRETEPSVLLQRPAAEALARLMTRIDGWEKISLVSGWRSHGEQQEIWDDTLRENGLEYTSTYVAIPGHSEHQTGLAIDLGAKQDNIDFICPDFPPEGACRAFQENAARHGFVLRYPQGKEDVTGIGYEPWHFRYVGIPHARIMTDRQLTLEEYIACLKQFPYKTAALRVSQEGQEAAISYIEAAAEPLCLEIPGECSCSLSGNNVDGFILTEWRNTDAHQTKLRRT